MTNIIVPELGESVVEARIARWLKQEGDHVQVGEALVALETEKVDVEVSAERAGVLTSIRHKEGADVKVGELLATVDETRSAGANGSPASTRATPTARRMAKDNDVRLGDVQGSGPAGRVMKQDIAAHVTGGAGAAASAPAGPSPSSSASSSASSSPAPAPRRVPAPAGERT